jgi:hypothetical protein
VTAERFVPFVWLPIETELPDIFPRSFNVIEKDWFGKKPAAAATFFVGVNEERLFFAFRCCGKPFIDPNDKGGEYIEGLWNYDVAEFFIADSGSGLYQEFNLSPVGSWWSMLFSGYRKDDPANFTLPAGVKTYATAEEQLWQAGMSVPIGDLSLGVDPLKARWNVCAIINGPERQFLSWSSIKSAKPDFHKVEFFLPLLLTHRSDR